MAGLSGDYEHGAAGHWIGGDATVIATGTSALLNTPDHTTEDFSWLWADGTGLDADA